MIKTDKIKISTRLFNRKAMDDIAISTWNTIAKSINDPVGRVYISTARLMGQKTIDDIYNFDPMPQCSKMSVAWDKKWAGYYLSVIYPLSPPYRSNLCDLIPASKGRLF